MKKALLRSALDDTSIVQARQTLVRLGQTRARALLWGYFEGAVLAVEGAGVLLAAGAELALSDLLLLSDLLASPELLPSFDAFVAGFLPLL